MLVNREAEEAAKRLEAAKAALVSFMPEGQTSESVRGVSVSRCTRAGSVSYKDGMATLIAEKLVTEEKLNALMEKVRGARSSSTTVKAASEADEVLAEIDALRSGVAQVAVKKTSTAVDNVTAPVAKTPAQLMLVG